ncbi:MAG: PF20097 family protein [Oscillospiraceae bacterium]
MNCPYCGAAMEKGRLRSWTSEPIYWLPLDAELLWLGYGRKKREAKVRKKGGVMLDRMTKMGWEAEASPTSYCCRDCGVFITKLPDQPGED